MRTGAVLFLLLQAAALWGSQTIGMEQAFSCPLLRREVARSLQSYQSELFSQLVSRANNPNNLRSVLRYLILLEARPRALSHSVRSSLEAEMNFHVKTLQVPEPSSHDGQLVSEFLYSYWLVPQIIENRCERAAQNATRGGPVLPFLLRSDAFWHLEKHWRTLSDWPADAKSREGLAAEYEAFLISLNYETPSELEYLLVGAGASLAELAMAVAAGVVVAQAPVDWSNFLLASGLGAGLKLLQAFLLKDIRYLIPFWGAYARSEKWMAGLQGLGVLPSQRSAISQSLSFSRLFPGEWQEIQTWYANDCRMELIAAAQLKAASEPVYRTDADFRAWGSVSF